jgi:hypothetical protein
MDRSRPCAQEIDRRRRRDIFPCRYPPSIDPLVAFGLVQCLLASDARFNPNNALTQKAFLGVMLIILEDSLYRDPEFIHPEAGAGEMAPGIGATVADGTSVEPNTKTLWALFVCSRMAPMPQAVIKETLQWANQAAIPLRGDARPVDVRRPGERTHAPCVGHPCGRHVSNS